MPAAIASTPEQRIYEAACLLPDYGGVTGWAALRWAGADHFDGTDDRGRPRAVPLAVRYSDIRPRAGVQVTSERLAPRDLTRHDGLPVTTATRSLGFEMRYADGTWRAVVAFDMAAKADLVSIDEMTAYVATLNGWTGVPQCREALQLVDENSWSPMETVMRLFWVVVCGFPHPQCNRPVFDLEGQHIGTPDLIDVDAGVVGEYDGTLHLGGRRRARDLQREAAFRRLGLEHVTMVAGDALAPYATIVPRMLDARARALANRSRRLWTVEPPPRWTSTTTVAARRSLSERQRERLLRYRAG